MTTKELFYKWLDKNNYELLSEYTYSTHKHLVKTKYGIVKISPKKIRAKEYPSIKAAVDKIQYLTNQIKERHNIDYKIIGKYRGNSKLIYIRDKYGVLKSTPNKLMQNKKPRISFAVDPLSYARNKMYDKLGKNSLNIVRYVAPNEVYVKDCYGVCKTTLNDILSGHKPTIVTAVDKNSYAINKCKNDKHKILSIDYKNQSSLFTIKCPKHGKFKITYSSYLSNQSCVKCGHLKKGWSNKKYSSKKSNVKLYIIKCFDELECFYKIGITSKNLHDRLLAIPYNTNVLKIVQGDTNSILHLESNLLNYHNKYQYIPQKKFGGYSECISKLMLK